MKLNTESSSSSSSSSMKLEYPDSWDIVKDWREELPPSPFRWQNLSITECVKDVAYLENNPLRKDISNCEMSDWLPLLSNFFDMNTKSVNPPAYDLGNGYLANFEHIFQFLKVFGTFFNDDYKYEPSLDENNFNMFSMSKFHEIRTSASERVFIDTFRILDSERAIPIIKNKHTAVGSLYVNYEEFEKYDYHKRLSPIKKPCRADHMVYIVGYGFDNGIEESIEEKTEGTECYLVKSMWEKWGYGGLGMVPVKLFEYVSYPKGVHVRDSSIVVKNDFCLEDARRKYYGLA